MLRALDKDPEKRFENAAEMIAAIDAAGHKPLEDEGSRGRIVWIAIVLILVAVALVVGVRLLGAG